MLPFSRPAVSKAPPKTITQNVNGVLLTAPCHNDASRKHFVENPLVFFVPLPLPVRILLPAPIGEDMPFAA